MARMLRIAPTEQGGYSHDNGTSARHIALPDGQSVLVTMENRCWAALDWLVQERDFDLDDIVPVAYTETLKQCKFAPELFFKQFRSNFKSVVADYAYWEMNGARAFANQF